MCFGETGKNPKICQKWLIFGHYFLLTGRGANKHTSGAGGEGTKPSTRGMLPLPMALIAATGVISSMHTVHRSDIQFLVR